MPPDGYRAYGTQIGFMHDTSKPDIRANQSADTEEGAAKVRPGASARGPIRELGFFYETLLNRGRSTSSKAHGSVLGSDTRLLLPQTIEALTARHRVRRIALADRTGRRRWKAPVPTGRSTSARSVGQVKNL
jgi:hypothetical protein